MVPAGADGHDVLQIYLPRLVIVLLAAQDLYRRIAKSHCRARAVPQQPPPIRYHRVRKLLPPHLAPPRIDTAIQIWIIGVVRLQSYRIIRPRADIDDVLEPIVRIIGIVRLLALTDIHRRQLITVVRIVSTLTVLV